MKHIIVDGNNYIYFASLRTKNSDFGTIFVTTREESKKIDYYLITTWELIQRFEKESLGRELEHRFKEDSPFQDTVDLTGIVTVMSEKEIIELAKKIKQNSIDTNEIINQTIVEIKQKKHLLKQQPLQNQLPRKSFWKKLT